MEYELQNVEYFFKGVSFCSIFVHASERYPSPPSSQVEGCNFYVSPAIFMLLMMRFYLDNVSDLYRSLIMLNKLYMS